MLPRQDGGGLLDDIGNTSPTWRQDQVGLPLQSLMSVKWWKHLVWSKSTAGSTDGLIGSGDAAGGGAEGAGATKKLRPTAYLDGLRGFAAFLVYIQHHELWAHAYMPEFNGGGGSVFENSWGFEGRYFFATMYGFRNFFTGGHFAVAIFYVISGYVLILKPLSLIQNGEIGKAMDNLGSALFRRWFRLYIPLMVTTLFLVCFWHAFNIWTCQYELKGSWADELFNWYNEFKNFSFVFKEGPIWVTYNTHLWTIPLEMRGSIITYVSLVATARATTKARLLAHCALIFYFMYVADGWYGAVFVAGMLMCDLDLLSKKPDSAGFPSFLRQLEPYKTGIFYGFFVISMWLSGIPTHSTDIKDLRANPGWYWMSFLKPQAVYDFKWFFLSWAAVLLVAAVPRISWLKRFFEGRFCQYLGRHSFALYLVHGPVLATLGDRIYTAVGWVRPFPKDKEMLAAWINIFPLPKTGPLGLEVAFLLPHIILLPVTLYVADLVTRYVDDPAIKFAQGLFKLTHTFGEAETKPEDVNLMRLA